MMELPPGTEAEAHTPAFYIRSLREILEAARAPNAERSQTERLTGDFYSACMDESAIEQRGLDPARETLDRIARIPSKGAITGELIALPRQMIRPFFHLASEPDAKDATRMIVGLDQGGLSLPDRDYYFNTDTQSAQTRERGALAGKPAPRPCPGRATR